MQELIERARAGDDQALNVLLENLRPSIREAAEKRLGARLKTRIDASDLTQRVLMDVCRDITTIRDTTDLFFKSWLKQILEHEVTDVIREHIHAGKRCIDREVGMDATLSGGGRLRDILAANQSTPSKAAVRHERDEQLEAALDELPPDQATAIRMRRENVPVKEIAEKLNKSQNAVSQLIIRGTQALQKKLKNGP